MDTHIEIILQQTDVIAAGGHAFHAFHAFHVVHVVHAEEEAIT